MHKENAEIFVTLLQAVGCLHCILPEVERSKIHYPIHSGKREFSFQVVAFAKGNASSQ
jgi:hypothetical protein